MSNGFMTFEERAILSTQLGARVFPLRPKDKLPALGEKWEAILSNDPAQISAWNSTNPEYNVAMVCEPTTVCVLEFDVHGGMKQLAAECGQPIPQTRVHTSGRGFAHWVFKPTDKSRALGNRACNLQSVCEDPTCEKADKIHRHEFFSFRANNQYVVGPGSIHPNGNTYRTARTVAVLEVPDWLSDCIDRKTRGTTT